MSGLNGQRKYGRLAWTLLVMIFSVVTRGQDFAVASFRILPNDVSAFMHAVQDLNGETCALIKVVGDEDFVFSSPLGIVKRRNEVGEIWIYVPNGSILLTMKHPQWGVWRDYRLPVSLESGVTYELVLKPKGRQIGKRVMNRIEGRPGTTLKQVEGCRLDSVWGELKLRPLPRRRFTHMAFMQGGFREGAVALGARWVMLKRHGGYVMFQKKLGGMPADDGTCDKWGRPEGEEDIPYFTGKKEETNWMVLAGGVHRLSGSFFVYEGLGYGERTLLWEQIDGRFLKNEYYSYRGIAAELGGIYRWRNWAVSLGVQSLKGKYWLCAAGLGFSF